MKYNINNKELYGLGDNEWAEEDVYKKMEGQTIKSVILPKSKTTAVFILFENGLRVQIDGTPARLVCVARMPNNPSSAATSEIVR